MYAIILILLVILFVIIAITAKVFGGLPILTYKGEKINNYNKHLHPIEVQYLNFCIINDTINDKLNVKIEKNDTEYTIKSDICEDFIIFDRHFVDRKIYKKYCTAAIFNGEKIGECYSDYTDSMDNLQQHKLITKIYKIPLVSINIAIDDYFQGKDICRYLFSENVKFLIEHEKIDALYNENVSINLSSVKCYDSAMKMNGFDYVIVCNNKNNLLINYESFYVRSIKIDGLQIETITVHSSAEMMEKLKTKTEFKYFIYPTNIWELNNEKLIGDKYVTKMDKPFDVLIIH
jgi:hypothetical protein